MRSPHFRRPTLFLYDRVQGGVGLSELLFAEHRALLAAALDVVTRCECTGGCPACVGPVAEVGTLGKETARAILEHLVREPGPAPAPVPEEGTRGLSPENGGEALRAKLRRLRRDGEAPEPARGGMPAWLRDRLDRRRAEAAEGAAPAKLAPGPGSDGR